MRTADLALAAGTGAVLIGGAWATPSMAVTRLGSRLFPTARHIDHLDAVALTFDDGPGDALPAFLEVLERAGATATFFVTGEQVERDPAKVTQIVAAGHEIGVHCYRHRHHLRLAPWQVTADMRHARQVIEAASGQSTTLYRPPYGVFSRSSWREADRQGWCRVLWARWGRDWETDASPRSILDCIGPPEAGDIILLHDDDRYSAPGSWRNTLGALPQLLDLLAAKGLRAVSVGELLGAESPHPAPAAPPSPNAGRGYEKAPLSQLWERGVGG